MAHLLLIILLLLLLLNAPPRPPSAQAEKRDKIVSPAAKAEAARADLAAAVRASETLQREVALLQGRLAAQEGRMRALEMACGMGPQQHQHEHQQQQQLQNRRSRNGDTLPSAALAAHYAPHPQAPVSPLSAPTYTYPSRMQVELTGDRHSLYQENPMIGGPSPGPIMPGSGGRLSQDRTSALVRR